MCQDIQALEARNLTLSRLQTRVIRSSYIAMLLKDMMVGGMMIMFASHVLEFPTAQTSLFATIIPLLLVARYPFLGAVGRMPRFRVILTARSIQIGIVLILLALPAPAITLWLLVALAACFVVTNEFMLNAVWVNMVSEITTRDGLGRFLGRLRWRTHLMGVLFSLTVFFIVGDRMDEIEYKALLLVCLLLLFNSVFWLSGLHDTPGHVHGAASEGRFLSVLRNAPLLRRPLVLALVMTLWEWPLVIIYLLDVLNLPADAVTLFLVVRAVGNIASVTFWGNLIDRVGSRRIYLITFSLSYLLYPLLLFIPDFAVVPADGAAMMRGRVALILFGFATGFVMAGQNVAMTVYQSGFLHETQGYFALNILTTITRLFLSALTAMGGAALVYAVGLSSEVASLEPDGWIWIDPIRLGLIGAATALLAFGQWVSLGVRDAPG